MVATGHELDGAVETSSGGTGGRYIAKTFVLDRADGRVPKAGLLTGSHIISSCQPD